VISSSSSRSGSIKARNNPDNTEENATTRSESDDTVQVDVFGTTKLTSSGTTGQAGNLQNIKAVL
jgi:hypothetical protein